ncbi:MAG: FAD-binding oxidoreductase [Spirochaetia bacterium]|nr:FAD-binding oxidoreductase [Spirochaetia bacterium]
MANWVKHTPEGSYRSLFRWGKPDAFKHPNDRLVSILQDRLKLKPADFETPQPCTEQVEVTLKNSLAPDHLAAFCTMIGAHNVLTGAYDRIRAAYGKTMYDLLRLREHIIENTPDAVLLPRDENDVAAIVQYCSEHRIPVQAMGAGSSVTRGFEATSGGVTLNLAARMNRVIKLDAISETVTVESGITGPALEEFLQKAKEQQNSPHNYTCGHFPQSFEFTTVGGWIVTRGAGQNSTYFGKIEDIVIAQRYVTPIGKLVTAVVPATAAGPDLDSMMMGSEGSFGILVSATLRIRRFLPQNRRRFSFMFPDFESGLGATREIMQSQTGLPSVFRLSDPEETDLALHLYGVAGTPLEWLFKLWRLKQNKRCLLIGWADGSARYANLVHENVKRIAHRFGAMNSTGLVTAKWEKSRFMDPYMRDDLMDFGIVLDTLECSASWENLPHVYKNVRAVCHSRPGTIVTTHLSHFYPQGANLYFIFMGKMARDEFLKYHSSIVDAIQASGASITHHHGIGRLLARWLPGEIGATGMGVIKAIKGFLDPHGILNPGVLGLGTQKTKGETV